MQTSVNQDIALALAQKGFRIFPCVNDPASEQHKKPMVKGWPDTPLRPAWQVAAVWQSYSDALVGIPTESNGLCVVDCDVKNGKQGIRAFHELCATHGIDLCSVPTVHTPSGGLHYVWRSHVAYSGTVSKLADGVDIRSRGNYVIAYRAILEPIPELPAAVAALLSPKTTSSPSVKVQAPQTASDRERAYAQSALEDECAKLEVMGEGSGRNVALNTAGHSMGTMVGALWIERETVERVLWDTSERNGYRAKDGDSAAWATLQSGLESGISKPREPLPVDEIPQYIYDSVAMWIEEYKVKQANATSFIDSILSPFDYESNEIEFAIQDFVPMSAITMFSGDAGCGKSTLLTWMAHAVSEGQSFLDFAVPVRRPVLYLDRENSLPVVRERLMRLSIRPNSLFKYWGTHVCGDVPMPGSEGIIEWVKRCKVKPLIIIDGQTAFLEGNEISAEDIRTFYKPLRIIANIGAAVTILHHTGKGESTKEFRGSNDIKAAIDIGYVMWNDGETRLTTATFKPFKARFNVTDKFAANYHNGEFTRDNLHRAVENVMFQVLQSNPGLNRAELETAAMEKRVSRSQARSMIDNGIKTGFIVTRKGDRNAILHYLPNAVPTP